MGVDYTAVSVKVKEYQEQQEVQAVASVQSEHPELRATIVNYAQPVNADSELEEQFLEGVAPDCYCRRSSLYRISELMGRGSVLTLIDQVFVSLTNFSTAILIGRFCSKAELGLYMLGYSVILFGIAFQQMLISSPYILIWPRLSIREKSSYTNCVYLQQLALGIFVSMASLIAAFAFHLAQSPLAPVMTTLACAAPLLLFKEMFRRVCFVQLRVRVAVIADFAQGFIQIALLIALARSHRLSASAGFLVVAASCSGLLLGWLLRHFRELAFSAEEMRLALTRNWHLGRWIFGSQILWALSMYSYPWIISSMRGVDAAGVWAACFGVTALGNPFLLGMQNHIEPRISHAFATGGVAQMCRLAWKASSVLAGSMLLFSLLLFAMGNRLMVMLYGSRYAGNGLTIALISLAFAVGAFGFGLSCGFFATGHGNLDVRISWVFPISVLVCGLPLVRAHGPLGAAVSLLIGYLVASSTRAIQFLVTFRQPSENSTNKSLPTVR